MAIYNSTAAQSEVKRIAMVLPALWRPVVFMSGDERIMSNASLLMIHNAWMFAIGDQNQLRKEADDLKLLMRHPSMPTNHINITEEELKAVMDAETWLSAVDALEMGFATQIVNYATTGMVASQSLRKRMAEMILERQAAAKQHIPEPDPEPEPEPPEPEPEPEPPAQNKPKNLLAALFAAERRV